MIEMEPRRTVEYKFLRQAPDEAVPKLRYSLVAFLAVFQVAFVILFSFFVNYESHEYYNAQEVPRLYSMFMDVHTMMFIGFGFLMTFLKRYGYSSVGFNFLIAAFVLEWALLVRGFVDTWHHGHFGSAFSLNVGNLIVADFCSAAVLISFGAVLGKASLSQLIVMAFIEVIIQSINEHIGLHYLHAYDVGESMYVHVFGAYFGMAVAKVLHHKDVESPKESSHYHSDLFAMIGSVFLWLYWPSFNSAVAVDEGQTRAIVNTFLSIVSSCVVTFLISTLVGKGKLNMIHIQNATLAGGVAIGTIADMVVQPYGAMIVGSLAGALSVVGYEYITPALKRMLLHDTCGVNNLHGMPGVLSGLIGAVVATLATPAAYGNADRLYVFYPTRKPCSAFETAYKRQQALINVNGTAAVVTTTTFVCPDYADRTGLSQAGYQLAALGVTLLLAIVGGALTGLLLRLPAMEQLQDEEHMFDDEPNWITPQDYSLKLTEVRTEERRELLDMSTAA